MSEISSTEQTIGLESARLFRVPTILGAFDPLTSQINFQNPVEIRSGTRRLGWASLYRGRPTLDNRHKLELFADLVFSYETPERLDIEVGTNRLYARLSGLITYPDYPFEAQGVLPVQDRELFGDIELLALELSPVPAYPGQPSLGEPIF